MNKNLWLIVLLIGLSTKASAQIGLYDIQASFNVNYTKPKKLLATSEFGTDYDLGITFLNVPYSKVFAFGAEAHVDYTRQNFSLKAGNLHFRRNEAYLRLRPLVINVHSNPDDVSMFHLFQVGLYADIGYTQGNFFYEDYTGTMGTDVYKQNGPFWGYGYNIIFRNERIGGCVGYGSKKYAWKGANNQDFSYSSRSFQFGVFYNFAYKG